MKIFYIITFVIYSLCSFSVFAQQSNDEYDISSTYRLGPGDKLKITVFGEEDLSGEFEVDGSGFISMPLIGNINVEDLDVRTLERLLIENFKNGYLVNPRINIEVLNFRPFFIIGEVNKPGSYPYVSNLTVINAIALAGGYTYRANKNKIIITRGKGINKKEIVAKEGSIVLPGDSIRVKERFF